VVPRSPPWSPPDAQQLALVAPARPEPPPRVKEPEMVAIPGGEFVMGSNDDPSEKPPHQVAVKPFFLAKFPVTVGEWRQCHAAGACAYDAPGEDALPVTNVSWLDAQNYATWLSGATQKEYRLPTEAEWEYAARGRATTKYWWGDAPTAGMASCKGCGGAFDMHRPLKVGSFRPNPFGLYDMTGLVAQWVSDCWHKDYHGAPRDGGSWDSPNCREHVLRGGSWRNDISYARSASRDQYDTSVRYPTHGFRVARSQ
jgi:formylglycine-generating enzyme required for sulfatase activity